MRFYGDKDYFHAELPDGHGFGEPVEIWGNIGLGQSEVIAVASNKYYAMSIIDAFSRCRKKDDKEKENILFR